jgi:phosphate-selective porin
VVHFAGMAAQLFNGRGTQAGMGEGADEHIGLSGACDRGRVQGKDLRCNPELRHQERSPTGK